MTESRSSRHDPSRRRFLRSSAGAAAALVWPRSLDALALELQTTRPSQDFWAIVRNAFLIPDRRIYLNVGTLGAQPRTVVDAVIEHTRRIAESYPPGVDWDALKQRLARLLAGDADGFVFPRNTTEGMNFVANGLELEPGDEILTTDHEHIGGLCPWQLVAARHQLTLRQLTMPAPSATDAEIVEVFRSALTARTRVISISHVTFTTGRIMPVAELVRLCRERDIVAVVDGAHPPGLMSVDLRALDPDFYASSPHKWLLAPQGTGFLWMREPWRTTLWPTLASGGWDDRSLGAHRFNHLGTFDESRLAGLDAALRFHDAIGPDTVYERIRTLRRRLIEGVRTLDGARLVSPEDDARAAGMVSFNFEGVDSLALQSALGRIEQGEGSWSVRTRVIGEYDYGWMRLSPHIYNSYAEIERAIEFLGEAVSRLRTGRP